MPKLKTHKFYVKNKANDKIEFDADVTVNSSGVFAVTFPDEYLLDVSANLLSGCAVTKPRKHHRVESHSMDDAIQSIREGLKSLLDTKVTHELVILYRYATECHYAKDSETGQVYPNAGIAVEETGKPYEGADSPIGWAENGASKATSSSIFDKRDPYSISLQATVKRKTTYTSRNNTRVEYFSPTLPLDMHDNNFDTLELGKYGEHLAGFTRVTLKEGDPELPYTEDAARFFLDAMLSLCALSDRLSTFFADPASINNAITNQSRMLPFTGNIKPDQDED